MVLALLLGVAFAWHTFGQIDRYEHMPNLVEFEFLFTLNCSLDNQIFRFSSSRFSFFVFYLFQLRRDWSLHNANGWEHQHQQLLHFSLSSFFVVCVLAFHFGWPMGVWAAASDWSQCNFPFHLSKWRREGQRDRVHRTECYLVFGQLKKLKWADALTHHTNRRIDQTECDMSDTIIIITWSCFAMLMPTLQGHVCVCDRYFLRNWIRNGKRMWK